MPTETLISAVIENVDSAAYYKEQFPDWTGDHNHNQSCPFNSKHAGGEDNRPSFSVNINGHGGAFCQACGTKIGSIIHFEKLKYGTKQAKLDDELAASRIFSRFIRPVLAPPAEVGNHILPWHTSLRGAPKVLASIKDEIQISKETVERFDLGWDNKSRRVTIPIIDQFGQLLNTRLYRLPSMREDESFPKLLNTDGFGSPAELYPLPQVLSICRSKARPPVLYWMTGERDTLLAWDRGIPSFCYTTGENVCKKEWADEIKALGIAIGIVQDNDEADQKGEKAGERGALKRLKLLRDAGIPAFIVKMPEELQGKKSKDFSDYIRLGGTIKEFLKLGRAKLPENDAMPEDEDEIPMRHDGDSQGETFPDEEEFFAIPHIIDPLTNPYAGEYSVSQIGRTPELLNRPISTQAIVSGKIDRTYSVPRIIQVGDHQYKIPISREMLQLVRENDVNIMKLIHAWMKTKVRIKILGWMTVTEVEIIPMIQPGKDAPYVNQRCYYFGPGVECNKPYRMELIPSTDMRTQETVGLIYNVEPVSNILDTYDFSDKSCRMLHEAFSVGEEDSFASLKAMAHAVATRYSHIFNRDDLHLCTMLTWLSPLQFEFPCEGIQRGWLNTLVLGDTETGKSRVCQNLTKLFQCGVFINAESCSYVGLVGGAVKSSSGMFILRWGKIPLYNRQLVVVEELSGLTTQEISYMSEIRSGGIARYDKAGLTGETPAKTRLVCLSNVRGEGKSLGDYNTGVQAAQALVGHNEDLARFDLTLTATDDEVEGSIINRDRTLQHDDDNDFTTEERKAFQELVMFAWSLKPEQIEFSVSAYRACLQQTLKLSAEYHSSLPVFKGSSGRLKLARIALSIACMQFAWDFEKKKLVVTDKHVDAAAQVLHMIFRKPSFGYARYSKIQFSLQKVLHEDEVMKKLREVFQGKLLEFLMFASHSLAFTKFDAAESMGVHAMFVERVISQMFLSNLLKKGEQRSEWTLSRAGRKWVEKKISEMQK